MYAGVPTCSPVFVMSASTSRATPKSTSLTCPFEIMMFDGLMSRWMMPAACAASSADSVCSATVRTSCADSVPRAATSRSDSPSTSSITRKPAS
jgi:hypothetical protein